MSARAQDDDQQADIGQALGLDNQNARGYGESRDQSTDGNGHPDLRENALPDVVPLQWRKDDDVEKLGWLDVAALIINKMVGTGIFVGPFAVLQATNNKSVAMAMWVLGFFYTVISAWIYLEFARDLPFTGGEMTYLDSLFTSRKHKIFDLLAYTIYAFYFTLIYNTANNSLQFARQVYQATNPLPSSEPDPNVLRAIAVAATFLVCGLLYFNSSLSRFLNRWTACLKLCLLFAVLVAGACYAGRNKQYAAPHGWTETTGNNNWGFALLNVLFAFNGWENATLVAGEIPDFDSLKKGFFAAVAIVGSFYCIIVGILLASFDWPTNLPTSYMAEIFHPSGYSDAANQAAAVLTALSALGSLISVTYTCSAVNRVIGWTNILPFSRIWRLSSPTLTYAEVLAAMKRFARSGETQVVPNGTPAGGIFLHWIVTVIWIAVSACFPTVSAGASFTGAIIVYGHAIATAAVSFGFLWFRHDTSRHPVPTKRWQADSPWLLTGRPYLYWILGFFTFAFSAVVIVTAPIQTSEHHNLYPEVTFGIIAVSIVYWIIFVKPGATGLAIFGLQMEHITHKKLEVTSDNIKIDNSERICETCHENPEEYPHRHAQDGYGRYVRVTVMSGSAWGTRWLRWLFWYDDVLENEVAPSTSFHFDARMLRAQRELTKGGQVARPYEVSASSIELSERPPKIAERQRTARGS